MARTERIRRAPRSMQRSLVTPEGVDLGVRLADAGSRASAFLLDVVILLTGAVAVTTVALFGLGGLGANGIEPLFVGWIVALFFLRNAYFLAFEAGRRAATPGKRMLGLRVASRDGSGLSLDQVVARNLMREIEVFLPLSVLAARGGTNTADTLSTLFGLAWALLFTFFPLFNRDRMRIGDLLAGTWVVEAPKRALASDIAAQADATTNPLQFTKTQLDAYGIAELQKLEEVLRGGNDRALAAVAAAIRRRIAWKPAAGDDRAFLLAYYRALRTHLERRLLFGSRRADKHSK